MTVTKLLIISGHVQGVGYRFYMERKARALGIRGWVRNRSDRSVEAMIQGSGEAVDAMIAWAQRGPPHAVVSDVKVSEGNGEYPHFEVRPSG